MTEAATGAMPDFMQQLAGTPARQPRQRRQRAAPAEPVVEPAPRKLRKPREAKAERAASDTITISVKEYASHRVTAFQREFVKLHKILAPLPAKVRPQILDELKKVLG